MRLQGPVFYLTDDATLMGRQLAGDRLNSGEALPLLRDEVSTDEIIPARYCMDIGPSIRRHCYQGVRSGGSAPIGEDAIARGGFAVTVAGFRYGKGSSREQAPYAERAAGIRLVMAHSFERIYRQNCHNLGLLTSVDLALLPRLEAGEDIPLEELCAGIDPLALRMLAAGGLFPYARATTGPRRVDAARQPESASASAPTSAPATLAQKIMGRHAATESLRQSGAMQFFRCDLRYSHEYVTPMAIALVQEHAPEAALSAPEKILLFEDHLSALGRLPGVAPSQLAMAGRLAREQKRFAQERGLTLHGRVAGWSEGICHAIMVERYAVPGQLVIGSDSHTPHVGALGCVAVGVGASDIAGSWLSGEVGLQVPRQVLIRVTGRLRPGCTEKDLMLHILGLSAIRGGLAIGAIVEFAGHAVADLDVDARCTLTNMTAEMGATSGIVAPDARTVEFLRSRRGLSAAAAQAVCAGLASDPDAEYDVVVEIQAGDVGPMVSLPGDPGNSVPISALDDRVTINRAYGGSCTAAKRQDMDAYALVLSAALAVGRRVHEGVEFAIQAGSQDVAAYCQDQGYAELFARVGATFLGPSCGACINAGPGASTSPADVTVSAQNRNFPGRSGPGSLYLASPLTVAASAIAGRIREYQPEDWD